MNLPTLKNVFDSKWMMAGLFLLAIVLFGLNMFGGGNTIPNTLDSDTSQVTVPAQVVDTVAQSSSFESLVADNFLLIAVSAVAIVLIGGLLIKRGGSVAGTGVLKGLWHLISTGFFALYGLVLGVMVLMLVWAGDYLAYISDFYQTVAVTMVVIGVALIIATKDKFWPLVAMIAVFGYLAVTSPEQSARAIEVGKVDGFGAALSVATEPTPEQPPSAEEQARRIAIAIQEAEVAAAQRVIEARAQVEAEVATQRAHEASYLPAIAGPCLMRYTDEQDCVTVKFEEKTQYDRYTPPGHCIREDGSGFQRTALGEGTGWWRYRAENPTIVQFFTASADRCD